MPNGLQPRNILFSVPGKRCCNLLIACLLLSGCSLVPTWHRPTVPMASQWSSSLPNGKKTVPAGGAWWQNFGSDELDEIMARGLSKNFNLQAAMSRVEEAQGVAEVNGAARYPALSLTGLYTRQNNYSTTAKAGVYGQASYEVDFWGKNQARFHSADALANASFFDAQTVRMTLTATIADTYFQVLSLNERIALAQRIADDEQRILGLIQTQARLGTSSSLEVEQQLNVMQTYLATVKTLQQQSDQARFMLAVLTGENPASLHIQTNDLSHITAPIPQASFPADLLRRRPDIQAAEARLISANDDIGAARAAFLPDITLTPQAGIDTLTGGTLWSLISNLTQPVFAGGALRGQLKVDNAHARELAASYKETLLEAFQDVETQLSAVNQFSQADAFNAAAVASAREADRLAQIRLKLGSIDYQTLLTVERTLYQSEDQRLQMKLLRLQATVGLFRALGGDFSSTAQQPASGKTAHIQVG